MTSAWVPRPEDRPVCRDGTVERAFGRSGAQTQLGACECRTWLTCPHCGEAHVWLWLCEVCASRRPA